jgi:hypothetical protein
MKIALLTAMIAAVAVIASPAASQAAFTVTVTDGTVPNTFTFTTLVVGVIANTNSPGVNGVGQVSDLAATVLQGGSGAIAAKTLTFTTVSEGFSLGANSGSVVTRISSDQLEGNANGVSNINESAVAGSLVNLSGPGFSPSLVNGVNFNTDPFSIGNTMVVNLNAASGVTANTTLAKVGVITIVSTVPAPPALLLAAFGIPALGFVRRWTRKVKSTEEMVIAA